MSVVRNQTTQLKTEWKIRTDALGNKMYRCTRKDVQQN